MSGMKKSKKEQAVKNLDETMSFIDPGGRMSVQHVLINDDGEIVSLSLWSKGIHISRKNEKE